MEDIISFHKNINKFNLTKFKSNILSKKNCFRNIKYILIIILFILQFYKNNKIISFGINRIDKLNNEIIKKNKRKIVAISYSNEKYQIQLKLNRKSALEIGKVDEYYEYGPNDIDSEFKKKNKDILSRKRGNGYWLWKPYFILKTLKEKLNVGDYLIYTDACILYNNKAELLVDFLINKTAEMWVYKLSFFEQKYTKRDAFILLGADLPFFSKTHQYNAAIQIYKKSIFSEKFLEEYLYYSQDKRIITDDPNTLLFPNIKGFIDNRHDQSILSILTKKYSQANSGKPNMDIKTINSLRSEMPYIFCHYRRMKFINYDDLKKKCRIK